MLDRNREYKRIEKVLTTLYCVAGEATQKWDMSVVKNVSAGGVMFIAPTDLSLKDKIIYMKIGFPELAPRILELKAVVLDAKPCFNARNSEIRAKFIDLSEENKAGLAVIDKIIQKREGRSLN